ncbi:Fic family protein [Holophaga foetida]|uniref:Fic family protein n=1 Tax=Holophaga foetida TaxID=35839 RepID=UPI0002473335|nr:Fic family protein [Holophaga foetida]
MAASPSTSEQKQRILEALAGRQDGLSRGEIQEKTGLTSLDPQVARRLLADMVQKGMIRAEGLTKARRYFLVQGEAVTTLPIRRGKFIPSPREGQVPLSPAGEACRALLARPLSLREPVSYRRELLDGYVPNETFYLPVEIRQRLATLGAPKEPEHPAGTYARQILQRLLIDLSWNSSRLEGNTYSLLDTEKLIEFGETAEGKELQETQMILNHKAAIEYMVDSAEMLCPNPTTVQNLHALLMENLLANPMDEGSLRVAPVGIRGTSYIPTAVPQVIDECCRQLLRTASDIEDPFEQSFFLLVHIPYLQPFLDGNKRTGRLAANIPFIRKNCIPITFMEVPLEDFTEGMLAVYEMNRIELLRDVYVFAYERSCARYGAVKTSLGEPDPFRLRYRTDIKSIVREVVLAGQTIQEAEAQIRAYADAKLPKEARTRFRTVVETELASLHDGNFARYQLRPSEFDEWKCRIRGGEGDHA